jgi:pimeloyl-ACP methyl ester carboxylesterase
MNQIELSAGTIDYQDTGGDGPTLVLLHGLLMDASLWDDVIADLSVDHRCVAPTLPLGAGHRPQPVPAPCDRQGRPACRRPGSRSGATSTSSARPRAFSSSLPHPTGRAQDLDRVAANLALLHDRFDPAGDT